MVLHQALFLRLQFAQAGLLREQTLPERCQFVFQALLALLSGLALVAALLRDRCLVVLKLLPRLLQLPGQCGRLGGAVSQTLFEPGLFTAQAGQGDLLTLQGVSQPLAARSGYGKCLGLLLLNAELRVALDECLLQLFLQRVGLCLVSRYGLLELDGRLRLNFFVQSFQGRIEKTEKIVR